MTIAKMKSMFGKLLCKRLLILKFWKHEWKVALLQWWRGKGGTSIYQKKGGTSGNSSCCDGGSGICAAAFGVNDGGGSDVKVIFDLVEVVICLAMYWCCDSKMLC